MDKILDLSHIKDQITRLPQIVFEVTDACNLKCKYCGYGEFYIDHDERNNQFFTVKRAIVLLDYLKELWLSGFNTSHSQQVYISFYGGEPLMNMKFVRQVVEYIEKLRIPNKIFAFAMTTNAMLLDKYMDYLAEKNFRLLISLDGTKRNHSYRVDHSNKNSFNRVYRNIRILQKKNPSYFEQYVNINAVLHNRNSVAEIYHFIKNEFGKKPRIAELNGTGIKQNQKELFMRTYRNKYENLHQSENYEAIQEDMFYDAPNTQSLGIYLQQFSGNVYQTYNDLLFTPDNKMQYPTGTCLPFSKKMFVTVNGKILPCERIGHQFALGRVTENEVILDFEMIADRYNFWFNMLAPQCSRCYNTKACIQCIFNLDGIEQKPVCKGFMNSTAFKQYQNRQMEYLATNPHLYEKIMKEVIIR
jgi:uncharacterized protein